MDTAWLSRTTLLIGDEKLIKLLQSHVLVVGLGGVGSFAAEFICRAGIGEMTIVDGDVVDPTNRNRQLPALATTHGQSKAELTAQRLLQINPELKLHVRKDFLTPDKIEEILTAHAYHYVMDCIDSVTPKITLLMQAQALKLPVVSSMGAGGKTDPTKIAIADLLDTHQCWLAFYLRKRMRRLNVQVGIRAVFSTEATQEDSLILTDGSNYKRSAYGTISYLPAAFGGVCASVVIRELMGEKIDEVVASERKIKKQEKQKRIAKSLSLKKGD